MRSSPSVSTLLIRPLTASLSGPALTAFFRATDLTPELVADVDARISPAQFCVAWAEVMRHSGNPRIALAIADATPTGAFGIVEYVCRSAPTLGEALRQWVRYLGLLDDAVKVGLVVERDRAYIRVLRESEAPAPASHELCFALIVAQARALGLGPVPVIAVELSHLAPADSDDIYRRWFDAPVHFDAKFTQLILPKRVLDLPLTSADPALAAILTRTADQLSAKQPESPTLIAQVRRQLATTLQNEAQIEEIAQRLGLTARSLQRRLKDEGTSFQAVREDVRRELASRYLDDNLSFAEISFLLGFSEPSAFFRAFKRWTGLTPQESRQARRTA